MAFDETDLLRVLTGADLRSEIRDNLVSLRWAHVTQLEPLQVRREGEFSDIDVTGTAIPIEALRVGDKVRISSYGAKAFIESSWDVLSRTDEVVFKGPNANDKIREDLVEQTDKIREDLEEQAEIIGAARDAAQDAVDEAGQALAGLAETVVSTTLEYVLSSSETDPPAPEAAWSETSPTRTPGTYIWMRVKATRANEQVVYSQPSLVTGNDGAPGEKGDKGDKGDTGSDGAPGAAGVGLVSTEIKYAQSTSGTTTPSESAGWTSTVPTLTKGHYLWTRSIWTYTDNSTETGYSVAYIARDGSHGNDGLPGAPGVGITGTVIKYAQSTSGTTAPTDPAAWEDEPPPPVAGRYVWTRTVWTYSDNSTETGYAVGKIGDTGAKGDKGDKGDIGAPAKVVSLTSTTQVLTSPATGGATSPATAVVTGTAANMTIGYWAYSVNGAAFSTSLPAGVSRSGNVVTITGSTMTARTISVKMAESSAAAAPSDTLTVAKVWDGAVGAPGSNGSNGATGADAITPILSNESHTFPGSVSAALAGSTTTTIIAYKGATRVPVTVNSISGAITGISAVVTSGSGTNTVTITVTATTALVALSGKFLINMSIDGKAITREFSWSVSRAGAKGATGDQGVSVTGVIPYFRLYPTGSGQPPTPSGTSPSGWSTTEPAYAPGQELWRSERVNFSSGGPTYTTPQRSSAYAAAMYVGNLAEQATKGLVKVGTNDPGHYEGRIWWQTNQAGEGIGIKVSVNNAWVPYTIVADQILVPSSVGAVQIADGAVTAEKMLISGGNLFPDPLMRNTSAWPSSGNVYLANHTGHPLGRGLRINSQTTQLGAYYGGSSNQSIPIEPGAKYRVRATVYINRTVSGATQALRVYFRGQTAAGAQALTSAALVPATGVAYGAAAEFETEITAPSDSHGLVTLGFHTGGPYSAGVYFVVNNVSLLRMSGSTLIENGAVTSDKVTADEGWFTKLSALSAEFNTAFANKITAGTIASGSFAGKTFTGGIFTGSTFRTAASGARVQMDSDGLRAYNASGGTTFSLTGASGSIAGFTITGTTVTGGTIRTAETGARIQMTGGLLQVVNSGGREIIKIAPDWQPPGSVPKQPALVFAADVSGSPARMAMYGGGIWFMNGGYVIGSLRNNPGAGMFLENTDSGTDTTIRNTGTTGNINIDAGSGGIYLSSNWHDFNIPGAASGYRTWVIRPISIGGVNRAILQFSGGGANMPQTTLAANVLIDSNGNFYRTSSARRFKNDIRDIGADPYRVLDVPVRDWVDATIATDDDSYQTRTPGVVAEEVEDAGLHQFVTYDEDGQTAGVMYDRIPLLLIPVVRDLRDRITRLEEQHG